MHSIAEYTNKTHEIVDLTRICEVRILQAYNRIFQRLIFGTMTDLPILLQWVPLPSLDPLVLSCGVFSLGGWMTGKHVVRFDILLACGSGQMFQLLVMTSRKKGPRRMVPIWLLVTWRLSCWGTNCLDQETACLDSMSTLTFSHPGMWIDRFLPSTFQLLGLTMPEKCMPGLWLM